MLVESNPFEIGTKAPDFSLPNALTDTDSRLEDLKGEKGTVIMFICNHCPFVIHVNNELVKLANDYLSKGINCIAISSNDVNDYPQDAPIYMKQTAQKLGYPFPYLYDETQDVAKAYDAACTPDFYVFNHELKSVYHGRLDDSRPGSNIAVDGKDIRNALDTLLDGETNTSPQRPSMGCSIKWK